LQPFGQLIAKVLEISGGQIDIVINALEQKGLVRRLAQPNLIAMSGETASFHAGGEVPIQTTVANGATVATETDYRPYGVRLTFTPVVLDGGLINLKIEPEVSELDTSVSVNGNPGFISRAAKTTVALRDGQSFAMAGLLQSVNSTDIQQLPGLGKLPIIGALFRSTSFAKNESDLVIVVTPHIVRPSAPGEDLYSPLEQTRSSNDVELFALGMLEVDKDMLRRFRNGEGVKGPYGHRLDLDVGGTLAVAKK
jgi:pilus assembly protein CpaC